MTTFIAARVFTKRETEKSNWSGRIGSAELKIDGKNIAVTLDGKELPEASINYLLNFSLQSLQDAYAGAESLDEATANWGKKRDALIDGTIGVRGSGSGMSDEERAELYVAENAIRAKIGAEAWKALDDDAREARVASAVEKLRTANPDGFAANVAARVAAVVESRKRKAAEKSAIAATVGELDI